MDARVVVLGPCESNERHQINILRNGEREMSQTYQVFFHDHSCIGVRQASVARQGGQVADGAARSELEQSTESRLRIKLASIRNTGLGLGNRRICIDEQGYHGFYAAAVVKNGRYCEEHITLNRSVVRRVRRQLSCRETE